MQPPDWFLALVKKHLSLAPIRVGVVLFEAGTQWVDPATGNAIIHGQVSVSRLQRETRLSRPAVIKGLEDLETLAGLVRHKATRPREAWGYALPLVKIVYRESLVKILYQLEAGTGKESLPHGSCAEGGEGEEGGRGEVEVEEKATVLSNYVLPTPPPPPRGLLGGKESLPVDQAELLAGLTELGASDPRDFLEKFALERVSAWLDWVRNQPQGRLKNPAGYIYRKLEEGKDLPVPVGVRGADPARFTKGRYGYLYRY